MKITEVLLEVFEHSYPFQPLSKFNIPKPVDISKLAHTFDILQLLRAYGFKSDKGLFYGVLFHGFQDDQKVPGIIVSLFVQLPQGAVFDKSNTGDQLRVLATVKEILKFYLQKYQPNYIAFSGASDKHNKLYSMMAKYQKEIAPDYRRGPTVTDDQGGQLFTFVNAKRKIKLTFNTDPVY